MNRKIIGFFFGISLIGLLLVFFSQVKKEPIALGPPIEILPQNGQKTSTSQNITKNHPYSFKNKKAPNRAKASMEITPDENQNLTNSLVVYKPELIKFNSPFLTNGVIFYETIISLGTFSSVSRGPKPMTQKQADLTIEVIAAAAQASDPDGLAQERYLAYEQKVEKLKRGMSLDAVMDVLGEPELDSPTKTGNTLIYSPYPGRTKAMAMDNYPMLYVKSDENRKVTSIYFHQDPTPLTGWLQPQD